MYIKYKIYLKYKVFHYHYVYEEMMWRKIDKPQSKSKFPCTEMKIKPLKEGSVMGDDEP